MAQQGRQWLVAACSGQRADLSLDGRQGLLGRPGVDRAPAWVAPYRLLLDAEAEEVKPLVDVADPGLGRRPAQAIGARTAAASCLSASACARLPATMITPSSA
jgi:hypothetical protein